MRALRAFGRAEDLDIAFAGADRPALVTALLDRCAPQADAASWWEQPVGARVQALLGVLAATDGRAQLDVQLRCTAGDCAQLFEASLPLDALPAAGTGPMEVTLPDGRTVRLRRPTGSDLRQWQAHPHATRDQAVRAIVEALHVDGALVPQDMAALGEAIAAQDPLVAFSVSCTCPACNSEADLPLDLEGVALQRLAMRHDALLRDVHLFATRYGWTEAQTLAVPAERRERYRALIEDAA